MRALLLEDLVGSPSLLEDSLAGCPWLGLVERVVLAGDSGHLLEGDLKQRLSSLRFQKHLNEHDSENTRRGLGGLVVAVMWKVGVTSAMMISNIVRLTRRRKQNLHLIAFY